MFLKSIYRQEASTMISIYNQSPCSKSKIPGINYKLFSKAQVRFGWHCAVPLLYLCNGRCLINFDLIWKYSYPAATIELFANWTSIYSAIRKLLSTLLHTHAASCWVFFLRLLPFKYNTHFVLSTKIEHDETSRDIHFLTPWNRQRKKTENRITQEE